MMEHGYAVRPRSTRVIADAAEDFLRRVAPEHLVSNRPLDLAGLVDHQLQNEGIVVYPVSPTDLPDSEAETRAGTEHWLEIWIREEFFEAIFQRSSNTNRARSTLAHELGHAVLHADDIRTGRYRPHVMVLRRSLRTELEPYRDSEWQAHTFAGALLIPRPTLRKIGLPDVFELAERFEVSEAFVGSHLRRIKRAL
jgi:Zn-dependent peptidase ImmA (M78 family)